MAATVLVIEDDPATGRLLESVLQIGGLQPVLITNAEDALERLPDEEPDVILCDLQLPGMDGAAFIEIVKASDLADTPVVLMSAYGEPEQHSADTFVGKPFDPFEVTHLIETMARDGP